MSAIVVTAIVTPKAGQPVDQIEKILADHAAWVQQNEPGTLRYALHKSIGDGPTVFTMIETHVSVFPPFIRTVAYPMAFRYKDKAAIDAHSQSPRFKEVAPQLATMVDMQLYVSQPVGGFESRTMESSKI
ncbi:antibiotic biosynthesis monooxygenase [Diplodia corticola]|uniref:Antibiotic biosynthesis monooxygenase n=1 Tax=Diplodia corticola TaxID=236234 RepID=A0A1J9QQV2_9PEZI|nr:antibiotic biosynthesis monooxygenase [Diplodia corticola]OJD30809.1 antibiotic biosynthesis monooxygenase [Diplodia corticola]